MVWLSTHTLWVYTTTGAGSHRVSHVQNACPKRWSQTLVTNAGHDGTTHGPPPPFGIEPEVVRTRSRRSDRPAMVRTRFSEQAQTRFVPLLFAGSSVHWGVKIPGSNPGIFIPLRVDVFRVVFVEVFHV